MSEKHGNKCIHHNRKGCQNVDLRAIMERDNLPCMGAKWCKLYTPKGVELVTESKPAKPSVFRRLVNLLKMIF
jgi:hypothetical protein